MYRSDQDLRHNERVIKAITHEVLEFLANTNNTHAIFEYKPEYETFNVHVDSRYVFNEQKEEAE